MWIWERHDGTLSQPPFILNCRGKLKSLQFLGNDSDEVFGLAQLPNSSNIAFLANLASRTIKLLSMPQGLEIEISAAASSPSNDRFYLGTKDGRIVLATIEPKSRTTLTQSRSVSFDENPIEMLRVIREVMPKKHTTAIRKIMMHADGRMVSIGAEPVAHVWQTEAGDNVSYVSFLHGLHGNVTCTQFADSSNEVVGYDDLGNIMAWNIGTQESRSRAPGANRQCPTAV